MPRFPLRATFGTFFAVRGTHLAAMVAYFALASLVPLVFLALAFLGLFGRVDESSSLVTYLSDLLPSRSLTEIVNAVRAVQDNARTLGILGGVFLLWSSLSLFSVLESAFNIVYGCPNRSFVRGKLIASTLLVASLVVLFASLLVGSIGVEVLKRYAPGFASNAIVAYTISVLVSFLGVFIFLLTVYYALTNVRHSVRSVLPGAALSAVLLESSFQAIPIYLRIVDQSPAAAIGGPAILLIWLYVMANVIVLGAEVNWALRGRFGTAPQERSAAQTARPSRRRWTLRA